HVYVGEIRNRGISDCFAESELDSALEVMDSIGRLMGVQKDQRLGYGGAEALVALDRTPNNTFPLYWMQKRNRQGQWPAPFPRVR
ncbi:MAG: hypothetical protein KDD62_16035, partial [Bdellovibrionales bacterium]|nr:hypothetical protein [Bdellovibrionales bacterium]